MARPIKETPILYGEDARRFEERMQERRHISAEERAKINEIYEALIATANFWEMTQQDILAQYRIYKLGKNEQVKSFDCGDADLNDFIIKDSPLYRDEKLAVTYVYMNKEDSSDIAAFFCLTNDRISLADFDSKSRYNWFSRRFANSKRLKSYPAVKIGRLGVSSLMKRMNIGSFLLYFIKNYFIVNNKTGCRFITVDAYIDAIPFYIKNGFVPLNEDDIDDRTRLLYFDLKDLEIE